MAEKNTIIIWLQCLRITHWIKNGFVFAALVFSKNIFNPLMLAKTSIAFILFGIIASSIYLLNDIIDLKEDKQHPIKRNKPIASGRIKPKTAFLVSIFLAVVSITGSFYLEFWFGIVICIYFLINLLYSVYLKHAVILDVFCVASGFVLRVVGGALVINVEISNWLIICTGLLALFLSFSKRRHELVLLKDGAVGHRRILAEYTPYFLDQMIAVVTSATLIGYILYTISRDTIAKFGTDKLILTTPFVLYGIFRYLYLAHKKEEGGSPTKLLITDRPLLINIILWLICVVLILYTK